MTTIKNELNTEIVIDEYLILVLTGFKIEILVMEKRFTTEILARGNMRTNFMYEEYHNIMSNQNCVLVLRPLEVKVVRYMWLFRHKFHTSGSLASYKACLVANRRNQQPMIDCDETFNLVVKSVTISIIISLVMSRH